MAQIPYVCGRLGELAQDIRWRTDQLPALREAGGAADLRQIAQHLQKLVSALREAALLLEEAGLHEAAAYTAQLSAAASAFHIRTEDYSRLTAAFDDWLQRMTPLLPDTETKTVNAAVIGRLMNNVRLGYYPTEAAHIGWLKAALRFPEGKAVNLLDPCCGEGDALQQLGAGENAVTYGAELDESRAEAAQSVLDHVAIGSYYFARISRSAFHLLFLNPPYLQMYGGARSEKRFLGESYDHLMMGGVLIYIIPYYRLTDDVCSFLGAHFDRLMAYRFCGEEFKKFHQIAILGVRKPRAENPRMAGLLEMVSLHPDKLPTMDHMLLSALVSGMIFMPRITPTLRRRNSRTPVCHRGCRRRSRSPAGIGRNRMCRRCGCHLRPHGRRRWLHRRLLRRLYRSLRRGLHRAL